MGDELFTLDTFTIDELVRWAKWGESKGRTQKRDWSPRCGGRSGPLASSCGSLAPSKRLMLKDSLPCLQGAWSVADDSGDLEGLSSSSSWMSSWTSILTSECSGLEDIEITCGYWHCHKTSEVLAWIAERAARRPAPRCGLLRTALRLLRLLIDVCCAILMMCKHYHREHRWAVQLVTSHCQHCLHSQHHNSDCDKMLAQINLFSLGTEIMPCLDRFAEKL